MDTMVKTMLPAIIGGAFTLGVFSLSVSGQSGQSRTGTAAPAPLTIAMTADRWQTKESAEHPSARVLARPDAIE
jgi:hypothetical protein